MTGVSAACVVFGMNSTCATRNSPCLSLASHVTPCYHTTNPEVKLDTGSFPSNSTRSKSTRHYFGTLIRTCLRIRNWLLSNLRRLCQPCTKFRRKEKQPSTRASQQPPTPYWEDQQNIGTQVLTATTREISREEREALEWDELRGEIHTLSDVPSEDLRDLHYSPRDEQVMQQHQALYDEYICL